MPGNKFIALQIPEQDKILRFIEQNKHRVPEALWTVPDKLHITLRFFQKAPSDKVVRETMRIMAQHTSPLRLTLTGISRFGQRVLWARPQPPRALVDMAARLGNKSLRPHLTLAKMTNKGTFSEEFDNLEREFCNIDLGSMLVNVVTLYETTGNGNPYEALYSVRLNEEISDVPAF